MTSYQNLAFKTHSEIKIIHLLFFSPIIFIVINCKNDILFSDLISKRGITIRNILFCFLIITILSIGICCNKIGPNIIIKKEFDKKFGGIDSDWVNSIQETSDGGYVASGATWSKGAGYGDIWILKFDNTGSLLWDKIFGGSSFDRSNEIEQTKDEGYIIAGQTESKGAGDCDAWILKLDKSGNLTWDKTFGTKDYESASSIQQTKDEGYVFISNKGVHTQLIVKETIISIGLDKGDFIIFKLDKNGSIMWEKTYGGNDNDGASSIQQTKDGGYIIAGSKGGIWTKVLDNIEIQKQDLWVLKLDSSGNLLWEKTFGGDKNDKACSIKQTTDEGYIVAGYTESKGLGDRDMWILKLDKNGNLVWDKTFGTVNWDMAYSAIQIKDGNYVVVGDMYEKNDKEDDSYILKLDKNGNLLWKRMFGGNDTDCLFSIEQTKDLGFIVAGRTKSWGSGNDDAWILKLDSNGKLN